MPLLKDVLASGLSDIKPTTKVDEAAEGWASAWTNYFTGASVSGVPVGGSLDAAKSAMKGALSGMNAPGAGATAIASGIAAFWGIIASSAATLWTLPPPAVITAAMPPPTLGSLSGALAGVLSSNASNKLSKSAAIDAIAAVLHASGGLGGIAMVVIAPSPPAPTPIL